MAQIPTRSLPPSERRRACSCSSPRRRLLTVLCPVLRFVNSEQYFMQLSQAKCERNCVCAAPRSCLFINFHLRTVHMPVGLAAHPSVAGVGGAECRAWPPMQSAHSLPGPAPSFLPRSSRAWSSHLKSRGRGTHCARRGRRSDLGSQRKFQQIMKI